MSLLINWDMPIEWSDGTPAAVQDTIQPTLLDGPYARPIYVVRSEEPAGWGKKMPKLDWSGRHCITVPETGVLQGYGQHGLPFIRNVDLSFLRFEDGSPVSKGGFTSEARMLIENDWHPGRTSFIEWPSCRRVGGNPIIILTESEIKRSAQQAEAIERMKSNPLFGSF